MRLLGSVITAASVLFCSSSSFAFFDVEAMVGKRWYKFENTGAETSNVASQEINIAAHLDPIPLIPIGFGLGVTSGTLKKGDMDSSISEAKLLEVDFEVKAWIPMVPVVTPYVKVKVPLSSKLSVKGDSYSQESKLTGMHLNVGIQIPIIPLLKVTVEAGKGMQSSEITEVKIGSEKQDLSDYKKEKANSDNVMVGVQVGF